MNPNPDIKANVDSLKKQIKEGNYIGEQALTKVRGLVANLKSKLEAAQNKCSMSNQQIREKNEELQREREMGSRRVQEITKNIQRKDQALAAATSELEKQTATMEQNLKKYTADLEKAGQTRDDINKVREVAELHVKELETEVEGLKRAMNERTNMIDDLKKQNKEKDSRYNAIIEEDKKLIKELEDKLTSQAKEYETLFISSLNSIRQELKTFPENEFAQTGGFQSSSSGITDFKKYRSSSRSYSSRIKNLRKKRKESKKKRKDKKKSETKKIYIHDKKRRR